MPKSVLSFIVIWIFVSWVVTYAAETKKPLTRKAALNKAEMLPVTAAFYDLQDGRFQNCIDKEVLKPCDTDWVTCIDDAWVVKFTLSKQCRVHHDGRLSLTIVLNSVTGELISNFPEKDYFESPVYCLEGYDCIPLILSDRVRCLNFIHAPLERLSGDGGGSEVADFSCHCGESQCRLSEMSVD